MRRFLFVALASAAAVGMASTAQASTLIGASCDPVTDGDTFGCLYSGNINGNANPTNVNGYVHAQNHYNEWAIANGHPTITLNWLTATDASDFGDFGSIVVGPGGLTGTFDLSGFNIEYFAVKYGDSFTLFEYLGSDGTGAWDISFQQNGMSHIAFFGSPNEVPEPATWAMMLMGFGATGFAIRRRRSGLTALPQIA